MGGSPSQQARTDEQMVVMMTNEFRRKHGEPNLRCTKRLSDIARSHTERMAAGTVPVGHGGFDSRAKQASPYRRIAENVACVSDNSNVARTIVDGWINSKGHRANMLGNFDSCGVALVRRGRMVYCTQIFHLGTN